MKAYCYGREIAEVVGYVEDLVVFRVDGEPFEMIGKLEDVVIGE